jgi:hypothetical protein
MREIRALTELICVAFAAVALTSCQMTDPVDASYSRHVAAQETTQQFKVKLLETRLDLDRAFNNETINWGGLSETPERMSMFQFLQAIRWTLRHETDYWLAFDLDVSEALEVAYFNSVPLTNLVGSVISQETFESINHLDLWTALGIAQSHYHFMTGLNGRILRLYGPEHTGPLEGISVPTYFKDPFLHDEKEAQQPDGAATQEPAQGAAP